MPETKAFRKLLGRPFWPLPSDSPKIARQCPPPNALCTLQTFESMAPLVRFCFSWLLVETIAQDPLAGANHLQSSSLELEHQSSVPSNINCHVFKTFWNNRPTMHQSAIDPWKTPFLLWQAPLDMSTFLLRAKSNAVKPLPSSCVTSAEASSNARHIPSL